jgi:hypothetical protein
LASHEKEGGVFVERRIGFAAELGHGFAEGCEGFGGDFHAQDVASERGIGPVVGAVAGFVARYELFDLAKGSTARGFEPGLLAFGGSNSCDLSSCGPGDRTIAKRPLEKWQGFEGLGYAEAFFGPPRAVAKEALDVFSETREAEMQVNVRSQRAEEGASFFAIQTRTIVRDSGELIVGALPVEMFGAHSLSLACRFWASWLARSRAITGRNASRSVSGEKTILALAQESSGALPEETA